jgi:lipoprotein-releasing system permease protein
MIGRFEVTLAARHLRRGGVQTALTIAAVASGVAVIVFISSLTFGLRNYAQSMIADLMPQVVVSIKPKPVQPIRGLSGAILTERAPLTQRLLSIHDWRQATDAIRALPEVVAVAPAITDRVSASRGGKSYGLVLYGGDPESLDAVTAIRKYVVQGRYVGLGVDECVADYKLVAELGISLGDHIRLTAPDGSYAIFRVAGLYDSAANRGVYKVFVTLRAAQSLYHTGSAAPSILVRTQNVWKADETADRIGAILPYDAASWTRDFPQVAAQFSIYDYVAYLVSAFTLVASGFAIASVLIVQVLQKGKQIGILKSMGARNSQIFSLFVLEGLVVALIGASAGAACGLGLVTFLSRFRLPAPASGGTPDPLFPTSPTATIVGIAMVGATVATLLAAAMPARRAAKLDPVEVMR